MWIAVRNSTRLALLVCLPLLSVLSHAAHADPPVEVRVDPDVAIAGQALDLVCDAQSHSYGGEVLLVGGPESRPDELQAIGRLLAAFGHPTVIPRVEGALPREAATRVRAILEGYEQAILARPEDAPCAVLRDCTAMGGFVGGETHCHQWQAKPPRQLIVLGGGILTYLELYARSQCGKSWPIIGAILVDPILPPNTKVEDLACEDRVTIVRTGASSSSCKASIDELQRGPLEYFSTTTLAFPTASHCDAVLGGPGCAARCSSAPFDRVKSRLVWRKIHEELTAHSGLSEEITTPDFVREVRDAPSLEAKTKLAIGLMAGAGLRTRGDQALGVAVVAMRPELLFGTRSERSWTYGPYAELGWLGASTITAGGGATLSMSFGGLHIAPSVGAFAYDRHDGWQTGLSASLFLGGRDRRTFTLLDGAHGLRIEARTDAGGAGGERSFLLTYQLDLLVVGAVIGYGVNAR